MATTTNYGWVTPDDTALVKDGAAAIRTLGSSADTTTKNLNPETTLGDLSFRSSTTNVNTRIPIGSSGQHLTVVAGVPAWSTASDQTPLTTKGDLLTFSTLDARLPVGATDGMLLTVDSSTATGLKYALPAGGGKVLQVVTGTYSTQTSIATDTTYGDSGLSLSITPSAATSKILVLISQSMYVVANSGSPTFLRGKMKLLRGATDIWTSDATSIIGGAASSGLAVASTNGIIYLDSPATTSATTYKTQGASATSGDVLVQFQRTSSTSTITLLEIGA